MFKISAIFWKRNLSFMMALSKEFTFALAEGRVVDRCKIVRPDFIKVCKPLSKSDLRYSGHIRALDVARAGQEQDGLLGVIALSFHNYAKYLVQFF